MRKIFLLLILGVSWLFSFSQQTKLLTAEKHNEYGLVYMLPTTAFEIEVTAIKETSLAGPFYKYAKKFAGNNQVVTEDKVAWTIENVRVKPYGVANTDESYLMQLKAGSTTFIAVDENGMILAINKDPEKENETEETTANIIGQPTTGTEYLQYVNEDFISAQADFKRAQLLGEELMEIRDAKNSLVRGTAETMPTDGRQLELMLESLENQEKALTQAFTGNSWKERVVRSYSYIPKDEKRIVLFRFSDFNGFVDADDYSGDPIYAAVKVVKEAELPTDSKGEEKKIPKDAVIYCVPGTALLSISIPSATLFSKEYQMSQFGMNFGLNPSIFTDKKEPSYAIFDPSTGALMELGIIK